MWPHGDSKIPGLIAAICEAAPSVFPKYGISTPLVLAHFMAQMSHECGAGTDVEENLNYGSPKRIAEVWPSRFTIVTAAAYAHNPKALANKVYDGRMGNRPDSDDGFNFRGRDGVQTTGREGYENLAHHTALDLVNHPELVNEPANFLLCSVVDFILCGCLPFAIKDDIRGVTHHLNGGYIGLDERKQWFARWKAALAVETPERESDGTLQYGDKGYEVGNLQRRLSDLGYYHVGTPDDDFGSSTRSAVLAFQADRGLATTGIVDQETRDALARPLEKPISEDRQTTTVSDLRDAGSTTIAHADKLSWLGRLKVMFGLGTAGGAVTAQTDLLGQAQDTADKLNQAHGIYETMHDTFGPLFSDPHVLVFAILFVIAGALVMLVAERIKANRLASHQSGKDSSR